MRFFIKKKLSFLLEEKNLNERLFYLLKEIYDDGSILHKIKNNQRQLSDKNVYKNINEVLKQVINEKN